MIYLLKLICPPDTQTHTGAVVGGDRLSYTQPDPEVGAKLLEFIEAGKIGRYFVECELGPRIVDGNVVVRVAFQNMTDLTEWLDFVDALTVPPLNYTIEEIA